MNICFNSIYSFSSLLKESVIPSLTAQQKKIIAIAAIAFSCLAVCYIVMRSCCFRAEQISEDLLNDADTYSNLGTTLPLGGKIKLPNGQEMTQQELYLKAIELKE
jgi:hypothetical protein